MASMQLKAADMAGIVEAYVMQHVRAQIIEAVHKALDAEITQLVEEGTKALIASASSISSAIDPTEWTIVVKVSEKENQHGR